MHLYAVRSKQDMGYFPFVFKNNVLIIVFSYIKLTLAFRETSNIKTQQKKSTGIMNSDVENPYVRPAERFQVIDIHFLSRIWLLD